MEQYSAQKSGCCSTESGTIFTAWTQIIFWGVLIPISLSALIVDFCDHRGNTSVLVAVTGCTLLGINGFAFGIVLLIGVYEDRPVYKKRWMIATIVTTLIICVVIVVCMFATGPVASELTYWIAIAVTGSIIQGTYAVFMFQKRLKCRVADEELLL